ncbi:MAG: hypothetical protein ACFFE2_00195 [Candidatus Thorarchaeota archaeon]
MRLTGHRDAKLSNRVHIEDAKPFVSVTERFLSSSMTRMIKCPHCGTVIDFAEKVNWEGPDTFTCESCKHHLSMRLIDRALRDLGIDP